MIKDEQKQSCHPEVAEPRQYGSHQELSAVAKVVAEPRQYGSHQELSVMAKEVAEAGQQLCRCEEVPEARQHLCHAELVSASFDKDCRRSNPANKGILKSWIATLTTFARNDRKRAAFTLAEVLITLGIIGVVSALTIPTFVKNYQQKQWNIASSVFVNKLHASLQIMNQESVLSGYTTTEDFVAKLGEYYRLAGVCSNDKLQNCFADTIKFNGEDVDMSEIVTAENFGFEDWTTNLIGINTPTGSALIAYNDNKGPNGILCQQDPYAISSTIVENCIAILYDVNGKSAPNQYGKDIRSINVQKIGTKKFKICGGKCTAPVMSSSFEDAARICGGADKFITVAEAEELAKYMYGDSCKKITTGYNGKPVCWTDRDNEKALALGFNSNYSSGTNYEVGDRFYVWLKTGNPYASKSPDYAYYNNYYQQTDNYHNVQFYAICHQD